MNNKYLSGLLAGVLTAGVLQGSDGKENMPGLGGQQTPVAQQQSGNNLSFQQMARLLAENSYRNGDVTAAEVILNSAELNGLEIITEWGNAAVPALPTQITHITLNENNGIQSNEDVVDLPEMVLSEPENPRTPVELTHLTIGENGEIKEVVGERQTNKKSQTAKKTKLVPYGMQIATKYFETADDLHNAMMVNSKFKNLADRNRINHVPVTKANKALFAHIETQQFFGVKNEIILENMYQYIIAYPVTKAEIDTWVEKLQNKHTGKALEDKKKPIVFEYQLLPNYWKLDPILEEKDDIFEIKAYWVETISYYEFQQFYYGLRPYIDIKRIVFNKLNIEDRKDIESLFDLTNVEIRSWSTSRAITYDKYLMEKEKYKDDNLYFWTVDISGETKSEEQRHQLKVLSMDKKVEHIDRVYNTGYLNLEFLGNVKCDHTTIAINPNDLQKPRSVAFSLLQYQMQVGNRKIYQFNDCRWKNDDVSKKAHEYVQYVKDNNLEYLSGFVNFANKPNYLTNEEWRKVMYLTGMVEELMNFVDQKFDEYEADPYAAPAVDIYGCDGYVCAGHNPYGQYYYGYSCVYGVANY